MFSYFVFQDSVNSFHINRESSLSGLSPKLLASFKLPKFDGVARNWKAWEKAFTRFLGIHQLDHVLEESFLDSLWTVPGAKPQIKWFSFWWKMRSQLVPGLAFSKTSD